VLRHRGVTFAVAGAAAAAAAGDRMGPPQTAAHWG